MYKVGRRLFTIAIATLYVVNVHAGHIDRHAVTIKNTVPVSLEGQWNLVLGSFLGYDQIQSDTTAVSLNVPGTWNNTLWKGKPFSGQGIGTYYKTVKLDYNHTSSLSLQLPDLSLASKVYINEIEVGGIGVLGTDKESNKPKIRPTIFDLPPIQKKEFTIIIHVANFRHQNSGLWSAPILGDEETLRSERKKRNDLTFLILGGVLLIGAYHLYLFFRRRAERYGIFFFGICITLCLNSVTKADMPISDIWPELGWATLKKIQYNSLFLIAAFNVLFVQSLYPGLVNKLFVKCLIGITSLAVAIGLLASPAISYHLIVPFQFITIVSALYMIVVLAMATWLRLTSALLLLVGMTITFLTLVNDILIVHFVVSTMPIAHFGVFVYVLSFSLAIANRFTNALSHEEAMSKRLETINMELEEKVHLRTAEIEWQQRIVDKQNKELKSINEDQKQLMAVVAHDLKSPLNKISGLSQVMQTHLDGELAAMNEMIDKVSKEGKVIIENLTNLWSYEKEDFKAQSDKFELDQFLLEAVQSFSQEATSKNIKLHLDLNTDRKSITTDKNLLARIFDNILSNALKFSSSDKNIWVSSTLNEKHVKIAIKDEGPGFTKADMKKVFGKFQKLSARPTGNESSTGLGLSIVKTLVEKLKGDITLNSGKGKGAEFIISLPVKNKEGKKILKKA